MEREGFRGRATSLRQTIAAALGRLPARTRRGLAVAGVSAVALAAVIYWTAGPPRQDGSTAGSDGSGLDAVQPEPRVIVVDPSEPPDVETPAAEAAAPAATPPDTLLWPVGGPVVATHGWGHDATMDDWRFHTGIDVGAAEGEAVVAVAGGKVTEVRLDDAWGWVVEIEHAPGYVSRYANLARPEVAQGAVVGAGDRIGTVGTSAVLKAGQEPRLHFELLWGGQPVDPLTLLPQGS
ncbi:MAG TPA: M23 family metallopeptidase [Bacillota bacterium]